MSRTITQALQLAFVSFILLSVAFAQDDESYDPEEVQEAASEARIWARQALIEAGADPARNFPRPDDTRDYVNPRDEEGPGVDFYVQHLLPDYWQQKHWDMNEVLQSVGGSAMEECADVEGEEAWQACYEQHQETPADLPTLTEQYKDTVEDGTSVESEAYQTVIDANVNQSRWQFHTPEEGIHDPVFLQSQGLMDPSDPLYESILGDCDTVTRTIVEAEEIGISEPMTCNQIYMPDRDEFECDGRRRWDASVAQHQALIATITPLKTEEHCEEEAAAAIVACQAESCVTVGSLEGQICETLQCDGLEGDELDACAAQCEGVATSAEGACRISGTYCSTLGDTTVSACMIDRQCGGDSACVTECVAEGDEAAQQCVTDCAGAGDDAFEQCMGDIGTPAPYNGSAQFEIRTFGGPSRTTTHGGDFLVESTPFPMLVNNRDPSHLAGNVTVEVIGGDGNVLTMGSLDDGFLSQIAVSGSAITEIRVFADLVAINTNVIDGCDAFMDTVADRFCSGEMSCTEYAPSCFELAPGVVSCEDGPASGLITALRPWHSDQVPWGSIEELAPRRCLAAKSTETDCDEYITGGHEDFCYIDLNGVERCIVGEGREGGELAQRIGPYPYLDNCGAYYNNSECRQMRYGECAGGATGEVTGRCYVQDIIFDCGESAWVEKEKSRQEEISCDGELVCMGTECVSIEQELSDPERAIQGASLIQNVDQDTGCFEVDEETGEHTGGDECTPEIFKGEALECKIPIGSSRGITPDCCKTGRDAASDETFAEYMIAMSGAYASSTAPGEAALQAGMAGRDGDRGSTTDTPDWMSIRAGTYYAPPGGDDGMDEGASAAAGPQQQQFPGAREWYLDPRLMPRASSEESNYVSRPLTSPFETSAARFGHVPKNPEQLESAKHAARNPYELNSFHNRMGKAASSVIDPELAKELYHEDGRSFRQVRRTQGDPPGTYPGLNAMPGPAGNDGGPGLASTAGASPTAITAAGTFAFTVKTAAVSFFIKKLGHIIFQCTEDEAALGMARSQKRCNYQGKYCKRSVGFGPFKTCIESREQWCCYNSAFAREYMNIATKRLGLDSGGGYCGGITVDQLDRVGNVNLPEWTAMLKMTGRIPGQETGDQPPGGFGMGVGGGRLLAVTRIGERPEWIPEGEYVAEQLQIPHDRFTEERLTPRRVVPGIDVAVSGPDGRKSTSRRVKDKVAQNAQAMFAAKEALSQRSTTHHDPELMAWYDRTTINPNPPTTPGISIPPDFGEGCGTERDGAMQNCTLGFCADVYDPVYAECTHRLCQNMTGDEFDDCLASCDESAAWEQQGCEMFAEEHWFYSACSYYGYAQGAACLLENNCANDDMECIDACYDHIHDMNYHCVLTCEAEGDEVFDACVEGP